MQNGALQLVIQAGPLVKLVLLLLLFFSIVSWAIIFFKYKYLSGAEKERKRFLEAISEGAGRNELFSQAKMLTLAPEANIFRAAFAADSEEKARRAMKKQAEEEVHKMEKYLNFLATTGSTAPFIGLFGTVWGIMNSFMHMRGGGSVSLAVVGPGIAEALIATAMGLAAAIPAVIGYNYYLGWTRRLISGMETSSGDIEAALKK
jgi:biopolymer transport protein TolQ